MSATLYALVVLQGTGLSFSPGYTSAAECLQQYKGPYVSCFAYDPSLSTWTAFFKLPEGGFRTVGKIASEDECNRYIGAFKDGIPTACRQLAMPVTCNVACVAPVQPPAPTGSIPNPVPSKPPEVTPQAVPPDPASLAPTDTKPSDIPPGATAIQVGGKQYTKVAGLTWVERESLRGPLPSTKPDSFADVSVGPNDLQSKDQPFKVQTAEAPKKRVGPHYYDRAPQPLQAFIDTVMLPFDFLSYPARRDW
jgi:hypothetical protein